MKDIEDLILGWHQWNSMFFWGELKGPLRFEIDDGIAAHALYDRRRRTIVLNRGFKKHFLSGPLVSEMAVHIILHEMAHAWVHDMDKSDPDPHGPWFAFIANRVAPLLGVPPCQPPDLWCWPDHGDESAGHYHRHQPSHGEILQDRIPEAKRNAHRERRCEGLDGGCSWCVGEELHRTGICAGPGECLHCIAKHQPNDYRQNAA